jgi:toxin ParE1/3/4
MRYEVLLTAGAELDLGFIYAYGRDFDSPIRAAQVLDRLVAAAESLATDPRRGSVPRELQALGIADYRQVFFKPYRVIYRIADQQVLIYLVADGRRDFQTLLAQRLLRP